MIGRIANSGSKIQRLCPISAFFRSVTNRAAAFFAHWPPAVRPSATALA
jgi:hypothetical protein